MRAILLDTDPIARALLCEILERGGHVAEIAEDGRDAWQRIEVDNPPEIAILDWRAPGIDGVELCRRSRGLGPKAPFIILLAAEGERAALAEGAAAGADDVLEKPLRLDSLDLRIRLAGRSQAAKLELAALRAEAARRSRVDQLTGVDDRQAIHARLGNEMARAARTATPLSMMLVDIDQFRQINQTFGVAAGDAVLTSIAARIRRALRRYDAIGRWGAEEFLLLLPGCGADHAHQLADRLLTTISTETVPTVQGRVAVTCSIGVLCWGPDATARRDDDAAVEDVIAALQRAASDAGSRGGNRVSALARRTAP